MMEEDRAIFCFLKADGCFDILVRVGGDDDSVRSLGCWGIAGRFGFSKQCAIRLFLEGDGCLGILVRLGLLMIMSEFDDACVSDLDLDVLFVHGVCTTFMTIGPARPGDCCGADADDSSCSRC